MDSITNIEMWEVIVQVMLPPIIAWINRFVFPGQFNYFITYIVCLLAALGDVWFDGKWNSQDIIGSLLRAVFLVVGSYAVFWKPSGLADKIEGIKKEGN